MTSTELKTNFHQLIDEINNDDLLHQFYELMNAAKNRTDGLLWDNLSVQEKQELIQTVNESYQDENLVSHHEVILKNNKWL
ncbi:MAG: hypothetical protein JNJ58_06890 [Chitinophagaceae bacterium]|nr:hypothetical protein [Chitinophagaceae bacterium]